MRFANTWPIPPTSLHQLRNSYGNLVHFAAFKNHIGFYPTPSAIEAFEKELSMYEVAKGSVKFPIDRPIPFDLVREIVGYRVKETLEKENRKNDGD